jgi:hypothetical protein
MVIIVVKLLVDDYTVGNFDKHPLFYEESHCPQFPVLKSLSFHLPSSVFLKYDYYAVKVHL